ncbi:MAG: SDR family NAD(P)-dependent oxidoreductase [Candidatus Eremiobacteraeota bacterium]|nr:SDR family NAD(P)-dependent oxidoreductase [Candidatus Eremiobacteraeota bacterium]
MKINGQAAIVTGGASGLGAATARRLAALGAKVGILDRDVARAEAVAAEVGGFAASCDVSDSDGVAAALEHVRARHGAARIVVNCAGIGTPRRMIGRDGPMPLADFERVIRVNLVGTFNVTRLAAGAITALEPFENGERGVVVMTASIAAFEGQIGQAAYSASKGGIVALTLPLARELAQFGVRVLTIAPGIFETPLLGQLPPEAQASLGASVPFPKRLGNPDEYAQLVVQICENVFLNGETIRLDGALRMPPR